MPGAAAVIPPRPEAASRRFRRPSRRLRGFLRAPAKTAAAPLPASPNKAKPHPGIRGDKARRSEFRAQRFADEAHCRAAGAVVEWLRLIDSGHELGLRTTLNGFLKQHPNRPAPEHAAAGTAEKFRRRRIRIRRRWSRGSETAAPVEAPSGAMRPRRSADGDGRERAKGRLADPGKAWTQGSSLPRQSDEAETSSRARTATF